MDYPGGEKWTKANQDFVALKTLFSYWQQGNPQRRAGTRCSGVITTSHASCRALAMKANTTVATAAKCFGMVLHGMQGTPYVSQGESWV
ncbi:alpha-amylase family glycosyl hydrolase [Shigella flexneri]